MGTHKTADVERLARILNPDYDAFNDNAQTAARAMACRALDAGVTLPPKPPKWEAVGSTIDFDGRAAHCVQVMRSRIGDYALARRLADHLNATGFTPEEA